MTTIKLKNGSGAPTAGDLVTAEPALDLTNKRLYTEDSSGTVIEVGTNPTSVTTGDITATGTATFAGLTTTADVSFGDNDKAIFGAGSDLQIYHDPNHSIINESGAGSLKIQGANIFLENADGSNTYLKCVAGGAVDIRYGGSIKLATTSTGIDVTGTVTADGLTVDGNVESLGTFILNNGTDKWQNLFSTNDLIIRNNHNTDWYNRLRISYDGDISFYEDTGTTAKLFWDAADESLRIGGSTNAGVGEAFTVYGDSSNSNYPLTSVFADTSAYNSSSPVAGGGLGFAFKYNSGGSTAIGSVITGIKENATDGNYASALTFRTRANGANPVERMRIDSSGNVGIGTDSPDTLVHLSASADAALRFEATDTTINSGQYYGRLEFEGNDAGTSAGGIRARIDALSTGQNGESALVFNTSGVGSDSDNEAMRIDSSGHLIVPNGVTLGTAVGTYAAANTLDDYEEGTWTPAPTSGTLNAGATGSYVKIGNLVHVQGQLSFSANGTTSRIEGLPFRPRIESTLNTVRQRFLVYATASSTDVYGICQDVNNAVILQNEDRTDHDFDTADGVYTFAFTYET